MKFGIIGPGSMAATWEQHLRRTAGVHEVVITPRISMLQHVDAVIIPGSGDEPAVRPDCCRMHSKAATMFCGSLRLR